MVTLACLLAALAFGSDLLARPFGWGRHDWDYFFFMHLAAYRSLTEFAEMPLWNPWSMGGCPYMGNPQEHFFSPWFLVHLAIGPADRDLAACNEVSGGPSVIVMVSANE
ncbi:MAG: hypothetical protein ABSH35_33550 [Isosphaeraceae bacterium]|jgi:hypothetical protein